MKNLLSILLLMLSVLIASAQDADKSTLTVTVNGVSHTIQAGDTVHLGYGSNPYGSFMYLGTIDGGLTKDLGGKTGFVKSIKHFKLGDINRVMIKSKSYVFYTDGVEQAIEKKEILGFNSTYFFKE